MLVDPSAISQVCDEYSKTSKVFETLTQTNLAVPIWVGKNVFVYFIRARPCLFARALIKNVFCLK